MVLLFLGVLSGLNLQAAPTIGGVTSSASDLPPGLPNTGIAQGSIFAVYGAGMGPATPQSATSWPLPSTQGLGGTTITATVNGITTTCIMFFAYATQVNALLPSATPVGTGTLTVTYQGYSGSIALKVLPAAFGIYTLNEAGNGPAVVTDANYNLITLVHPAHPGDWLILWGTGLGPVTGDETMPPVQVDLGTGIQVWVQGQPAVVKYAGRSGNSGLDQVNFVVPVNLSGGCKTSIAVLEKGVAGNVATTAIAPAGQSTCNDTSGSLTSANLQKAVSTGTLNIAGAGFTRFDGENDFFVGQFLSYPLGALIRSWGGLQNPSTGSCAAYEFQGNSLYFTDPIQGAALDAGPSLTITGPGGTKTESAISTGNYADYALGASSSPWIQPGTYTVTNGAGGANVGPFTWAITLPPPVSFTNFPSMVNRSQDLTLTWTNSNAFALVEINGFSGVPTSTTTNSYVEFFCTADASAGQFTIPSVILQLLPANGYGAYGQRGTVGIEISGVALNSYPNVQGSPGLDEGFLTAFTANGGLAQVQ